MAFLHVALVVKARLQSEKNPSWVWRLLGSEAEWKKTAPYELLLEVRDVDTSTVTEHHVSQGFLHLEMRVESRSISTWDNLTQTRTVEDDSCSWGEFMLNTEDLPSIRSWLLSFASKLDNEGWEAMPLADIATKSRFGRAKKVGPLPRHDGVAPDSVVTASETVMEVVLCRKVPV